MDATHISTYRSILEKLVADLRASLGQLDTAPVSPDSAIGRLTRMDAMQSQQLAKDMERRQLSRLREAEQALRRIEHGEYGVCANCGEEISAARLRVKPEARLCLQCASR